MRNYNNTLLKEKILLIVLCVILAGVVGWLIGSSMAEEPDWDVCYPMANTNIQWTYAEVNVK
jgi:hypothetical protein